MPRYRYVLLLQLSLPVLACAASAQPSYSPDLDEGCATNAYWADTHVHTSYSTDAYFFGNRLDPSQAYRLARGEAITAGNGMQVRLHRPLDFLVIADHAESLGLFTGLEAADPVLLASDAGKRLIREFKGSYADSPLSDATMEGLVPLIKEVFSPRSPVAEARFERRIWGQVTELADRYNDPGRCTAFIGYEWTAWLANSANLHRVVVFKDDARKTNQILPFSATQSTNPKDLWTYMSIYEQRTGGEVLAIPHNGNLSYGAMFPYLSGPLQ
jgi:hypothetical protein